MFKTINRSFIIRKFSCWLILFRNWLTERWQIYGRRITLFCLYNVESTDTITLSSNAILKSVPRSTSTLYQASLLYPTPKISSPSQLWGDSNRKLLTHNANCTNISSYTIRSLHLTIDHILYYTGCIILSVYSKVVANEEGNKEPPIDVIQRDMNVLGRPVNRDCMRALFTVNQSKTTLRSSEVSRNF